LAEQAHLADLGLAVSKINHDLRNILASAQLISDRLRRSRTPRSRRFAPKLVRTLDRAAVLYRGRARLRARTGSAAVAPQAAPQRQLVEECRGLLGIDAQPAIEFENAVDHCLRDGRRRRADVPRA
jgi:hypothetical protein